jgi:hypothetical protein
VYVAAGTMSKSKQRGLKDQQKRAKNKWHQTTKEDAAFF